MLLIGALIFILSFIQTDAFAEGGNKNMKPVDEKTVLMIVAHQNYRDEELEKPKEIIAAAGGKVVIASSALGEARGMLGGSIKPQLLLKDASPKSYDAVVFVGGVGASQYWNDPKALSLARQAYSDGKIVAAICIAPVTLANAGVLKGKKATVWPSEKDKLISKGAEYTGAKVQTDGKIITADGPSSAAEFGQEIVKALRN